MWTTARIFLRAARVTHWPPGPGCHGTGAAVGAVNAPGTAAGREVAAARPGGAGGGDGKDGDGAIVFNACMAPPVGLLREGPDRPSAS
ncbi:hypothetical protein CRV15_26875 [Streptomyces clavuligerus]|nr:hypothetical protein D1794_27510 [Streptomyces clavuligerus]QCS08914.1 hypothetical protein CRV15_26875 [Streptomyces clavuligerus]